jgi:pSer/pThr/pTyr-binding forkhead associated (FHA) protein
MIERTQPEYGAFTPDPEVVSGARATERPVQPGTMLVGMEGLYAGQVFVLARETVTIGRDPASDIVLGEDPTVSRSHARIVLNDVGHVLQDEGSSNGTFVNSVLVRTCVLSPGDVIQCGSTRLKYQ